MVIDGTSMYANKLQNNNNNNNNNYNNNNIIISRIAGHC